MKQIFEDFIELIKISCKKDPWAKNAGIKKYCYELKKEADEVIQAIEKEDNENLKEELGDILHDWAHIVQLAEEKKLFKIKDVLDNAIEKINRRNPYLKTDKDLSLKDARKIWLREKEKEKAEKKKSCKFI